MDARSRARAREGEIDWRAVDVDAEIEARIHRASRRGLCGPYILSGVNFIRRTLITYWEIRKLEGEDDRFIIRDEEYDDGNLLIHFDRSTTYMPTFLLNNVERDLVQEHVNYEVGLVALKQRRERDLDARLKFLSAEARLEIERKMLSHMAWNQDVFGTYHHHLINSNTVT